MFCQNKLRYSSDFCIMVAGFCGSLLALRCVQCIALAADHSQDIAIIDRALYRLSIEP